jgi:hypothetical protein
MSFLLAVLTLAACGEPSTPTPTPTATRTTLLSGLPLHSSPTPTSTSAPTTTGDLPSKSCSPSDAEPPCGPGAEIGKPYDYQVYTHCGIIWAYFNGRYWKANPVLDDGNRNPPPGWDNPYDNGSMTLLDDTTARFTSRNGLTAHFQPLPVEVQSFPGEIFY